MTNRVDVAASRCVVERNVSIATRDGTVLRADVYRPDDNRRHPVLLGRTQYGKTTWGRWIEPERTAAEAGFAVVINDMRGQFASDGQFDPFRWDVDDSYDVVEWCAEQAWSSGRVGMFGSSSCGFVQLLAAVAQPPHLVAIAPMQTWSSFGRGCIYEPGGGYSMHTQDWALLEVNNDAERRLGPDRPDLSARRQATSRAAWEVSRWYRHLPLSDFPPLSRAEAPWYYAWLEHPDDDDWWADRDVTWRYDRIQIPSLHLVGWFDRFSLSTIRNYVSIVEASRSADARARHKITVGPWPHGVPVITQGPNRHFGPAASIDVRGLTLRWYDHWLKGIDSGLLDEPPVRLYVQGAEAWRDAPSWPVPGTVDTRFHLHSDGGANSLEGDGWLSPEPPGDEVADTYRYDPADPTPSVPGRLSRPAGPVDRRPIEGRPDVLVYSTTPLESEVEVVGPVRARLWASTDVLDTDWAVCLTDVHPDGSSYRISDGMIRARYRQTQRSATLLDPGRLYAYEIVLWPVAHVFLRGHRIRADIASASFPQIDANPNTGAAFATAPEGRPATQRVFHDRQHPSHVTLPVILRTEEVGSHGGRDDRARIGE